MRVFYLMLRIPLLRYFTPNVRQTAFRRRQSRRSPQMQLIREGKQRGLCSNWFVNKDHLHIAVDETRVYWAPLSIAVMQKLRAKSCAQRCERRFLRAFPCLRVARNGFDWGHKDFREDYTQVDVTPLKKSFASLATWWTGKKKQSNTSSPFMQVSILRLWASVSQDIFFLPYANVLSRFRSHVRFSFSLSKFTVHGDYGIFPETCTKSRAAKETGRFLE